MVERQPRVVDRPGGVRREERVPADGAADARGVLRALPGAFEVRNHDDALDRGQLARRSRATLSRIGSALPLYQ